MAKWVVGGFVNGVNFEVEFSFWANFFLRKMGYMELTYLSIWVIMMEFPEF